MQKHCLPSNDWLVLPLTSADQQTHIDRSEQLLASMASGQPPVLSWSQAEPVGLVLGFSQKQAILNTPAAEALHIPVYHRRAGGTAVLVGPHLLSLDVVLPTDHPLVLTDVVESYRWLGETWTLALRSLGIKTRIISPAEAHAQRYRAKSPDHVPTFAETREALLRRACYGANSSYEVVVGQRKVVGLDMIRRRHASLLQAGVLLHWETDTLAQLLGHTPQEQAILREGLKERAVGLDALAGHPISAQAVMQAFETALFSGWRPTLAGESHEGNS